MKLLLTYCRGWEELFTKCPENLNSLTAMKMYLYYKGLPVSTTYERCINTSIVFEEDAASWKDKLNRIHVLFGLFRCFFYRITSLYDLIEYGSTSSANGCTLKGFFRRART
jgi:hypothetical protein